MTDHPMAYDEWRNENAALRVELSVCRAALERQVRSEEALRISEERLRRAAESAGAVVYDFDLRPGGEFVLIGMERMTGLRPWDVCFTLDWWMSRIHPGDAAAYRATLEQDLRQGGITKSQFRILHVSGEWIRVESSREVVMDETGRAIRLIGVFVNITQRADAEAALRESETRYRRLADTMPQVVFTATAGGLLDYVNRPGLDYMGMTLDQATGLGWLKAIHPEDQDTVVERWLACIETGEPYELEHRMKRADGHSRWQLARALPVQDEHGGIVRWIGTSTDIHDLKQMEMALEHSRLEAERQAEELDRVYQTSPVGLAFLDRDLRFIRVNRMLAELQGLPVDAHIGRRWRELLSAERADRLEQVMRRVINEGEPAHNVAIDADDGPNSHRNRNWVGHFYPMKNRRGAVLGVNVVIQDSTERHRTEEAVRKSHAFIRQIIDTDPNFIFAKDRDGRFTLVNQAVADCYGTTVQELVGKTDADFNGNPEEIAYFRQKDRQVLDSLKDLYIPEETITDAAGKLRWLQTVKRPLFDGDGVAAQVLGVATDITQRKLMEQALRASEERLQAIMDKAPAAIFIKDREGRHLFMNEACCRSLDLDRRTAIGKTERELFSAELADQLRHNDLRVWESEDALVLEEHIPEADGLHTYLSQKFLLKDAIGTPYALCGIATDITERKRAEERQRFMAGLSERLRAAADADTLLAGTVEAVGAFVHALHCSLAENDAAVERAELRASWSRIPTAVSVPRVFAVASYGSLVAELTRGCTVRCGDAETDPRTAPTYDLAYRPFGTRSFLCIPLLRNGRWVATFSVAFHDVHDWTDDEVGMLETLAERTWAALEKFRNERAVRESEERLRLALTGGQMGAWDVDLSTNDTLWDAKEFSLLGLSEGRVAPSPEAFYHQVHSDDLAVVRESVQRAVESTGTLEHEFRIVLSDGSIRWLAAKGQVLTDSRGKPVRMIGVNFDVTERKRTETRLQSFAQELEARVEERTKELVTLHGQLRALATELNLTEQRERKRLATDLHDYLAQLLALVRMKLGQMKQLKPVPAQTELIQEAETVLTEALTYTRTLVTQLSPPVLHDFGLPVALRWLAQQMVRQELSVDIRQSVPDRLYIPEDQAVLLFQSVRELLTNVRKHAGVNDVTVAIDQDDDRLTITVRDGGAGMDVEAATLTTAQPSSTSSKFGLFSIRERMLAIGGRFEIQSTPGAGMTAQLVLPLAPSDEGRVTSPESQAASTGTLTGGEAKAVHSSHTPLATGRSPLVSPHIRVLLVDDHPMVREGLKGLLQQHEDVAVVGEAWDGEEAVAFADKLRPDCVIMDVNMPRIDGIEATRRIKAAFRQTAIVGLSVNTSREVEEAMRRAGADDFLSKGAPVQVVYDAIVAAKRRCLEQFERRIPE